MLDKKQQEKDLKGGKRSNFAIGIQVILYTVTF